MPKFRLRGEEHEMSIIGSLRATASSLAGDL
jgi:hypothetical protein